MSKTNYTINSVCLITMTLLFAVGCGSNNSVKVDGKVDVNHKVDLFGSLSQLDQICKTQYPDDPNAEAKCFREGYQAFIKLISGNTSNDDKSK
jgi:hypothetical protein